MRGDVIVAINGEVSKFMTHDEVVGAIRLHNERVILTVMSPENVDQVLQSSPPLSRTSSVIVHNKTNIPLDSNSPDIARKSVSEYGSNTALSGICEESDGLHRDDPSEDVLVDKTVTEAIENNPENNDPLYSGSHPEEPTKTDILPAEDSQVVDDEDDDEFAMVQQVQLDVKIRVAETIVAEDEEH